MVSALAWPRDRTPLPGRLVRVNQPLLAVRPESVTASTGFGLVEDIQDLVGGIRSGSWIESTLGGFSTAMDVAGTVFDPLANLAAWGVAWLLEHVQPLRDALNALAGDHDQIHANAQTWHNIATALATTTNPVTTAPAGWAGPAATTHHDRARDNGLAIRGLASGASGLSTVVEGAGMLVATVHTLVRDLIAQFVATLAVRLPQWAAAAGLTLGIATPAIALQVTALVARYTTRIKHFLKALITSLRRLATSSERLKRLIDELSLLYHRLTRPPAHARSTLPGTASFFTEGTVRETYSIEGISDAEWAMLNRTIMDEPTMIVRSNCTDTYKVAFDDGTHGIFKPINSERSGYPDLPAGGLAYREVAASRLDEQLGFGLVPTTTLRQAGPPELGPGSMQRFVPGWGGNPPGTYPRLQEERMAVLDYLMANADRNWDNYRTALGDTLVDNGRLVAIDHGLAFPNGASTSLVSSFVLRSLGRDLSPEVVGAVRAADPERIRTLLRGSGLEDDAVTGTLNRLREVQVNGKITGEAWPGEIANGWYQVIRGRLQ